MAYRIRVGRDDDYATLAAIERDAAQRFREIGFDFCADGPVRDAEEHRRGLEDGRTLVGETAAGEAAGFALVWRLDGRAHLVELSVARRHQGRGLGRRLIGEAEAWAADQGLAEITLTSFRDVPWNAPFYRSLGYVVFEPGEDRPGLAAVIAEERDSGFAGQPRVAMRKVLEIGAVR